MSVAQSQRRGLGRGQRFGIVNLAKLDDVIALVDCGNTAILTLTDVPAEVLLGKALETDRGKLLVVLNKARDHVAVVVCNKKVISSNMNHHVTPPHPLGIDGRLSLELHAAKMVD